MDSKNSISKEDIVRELSAVIDPELHIDIYSLGLIYAIEIKEEGIAILMTLTTPLCPYAADIDKSIRAAMEKFQQPVNIEVTFSPSWVVPPHLRAILGV